MPSKFRSTFSIMAIKISYGDLEIISDRLLDNENFTKLFKDFIAERKDDYYFSGRDIDCVKVLEITTEQLKNILDKLSRVNRKYPSLYNNIRGIYQSAIISYQERIFLYGRTAQK